MINKFLLVKLVPESGVEPVALLFLPSLVSDKLPFLNRSGKTIKDHCLFGLFIIVSKYFCFSPFSIISMVFSRLFPENFM